MRAIRALSGSDAAIGTKLMCRKQLLLCAPVATAVANNRELPDRLLTY